MSALQSTMFPTFTPLESLLGGALIGIATATLLLASGRIAGISGILGRALWPESTGESGWRWAFLLGLPLGAGLVILANGPLVQQVPSSIGRLAVAGLLVGFGTRLANGCTSGHGICGISRGAPRSITATLCFMTVAGSTVFISRHLLGVTQ